MASLDFPASPTTGQLFSAANGVTYIYNGTLWLVQAGPGGGTGDFCATMTGGTLPTVVSTLVLTTINTGNSGGWYNTSTGRYTPPAGRYYLFGWLYGQSAAGGSSINVYLSKNGTLIPNIVAINWQVSASAATTPAISVTVDANGSDYFELKVAATAGSPLLGAGFGAFPLTGMQGPAGPYPSGAMYLYSEQVLVAPANAVIVTVPVGCKAYDLQFELFTDAAAQEATNLGLQTMQSGVPYSAALHHSHIVIAQDGTFPINATATNATYWAFGGAIQWAGNVRGSLAPNLAIGVFANVLLYYVSLGGPRRSVTAGIDGGPARSTVTGFRMFRASGGNFQAGSSLRAWVSS